MDLEFLSGESFDPRGDELFGDVSLEEEAGFVRVAKQKARIDLREADDYSFGICPEAYDGCEKAGDSETFDSVCSRDYRSCLDYFF